MIVAIILCLLCLIIGFIIGSYVMWHNHKRRTVVLASIVRRLLIANNPGRAIRLLKTYEDDG